MDKSIVRENIFDNGNARSRRATHSLSKRRLSNRSAPDYIWAHGPHAAAYGQLGRTDDANTIVANMLDLRPDIEKTARARRRKFFRYQEDLLDHFMDGLRKAGLNIRDETPASD